jgi:hypothetical protein
MMVTGVFDGLFGSLPQKNTEKEGNAHHAVRAAAVL